MNNTAHRNLCTSEHRDDRDVATPAGLIAVHHLSPKKEWGAWPSPQCVFCDAIRNIQRHAVRREELPEQRIKGDQLLSCDEPDPPSQHMPLKPTAVALADRAIDAVVVPKTLEC